MVNETTPLSRLIGWKRYVKIVSEAVRKVIPEARVYLTGGAAESRLTIESDIDLLVVLPREIDFREAVELRAKILEEAEKLTLPPHAPVELHLISNRELGEYRKRGKVISEEDI